MALVKFDNRGGNKIEVNRAKFSFTIPAHGVVEAKIPDTAAALIIEQITSRHPAIKAYLVSETAAGEQSPSVVDDTPADNENQQEQEANESTEEPQGESDKLSFEDFNELVGKVKKGSAGWWTVEAAGQTFRVRSAKDDADAVRMAYDEYKGEK